MSPPYLLVCRYGGFFFSQSRLTSTDAHAYFERSKHVDRLEVNAYFGRSKTTSLKSLMTKETRH